MVRELTAVSNFPGRAEMGTWRHGGIFPTGWIISCGWLPDLATTSHAYGYVRKIQMDCELWDFRLVIQSCLDIRPWAAFTWRHNSSFPSGRWSFFYYATDQLSTYIDLKWGEKSMKRMKIGVFFQKMHKGSERTLLFFRRPSWDPRWREAQDFAWGSWACNTSCVGFERVWSAKMKVMEMSGNWCWSLILPACYCWLSCKDDAIDSKMDIMSWCQRLRAPRCKFAAPDRLLKLSSDEVFTISPIWGWNQRAPWIPILSCSYSCYLGVPAGGTVWNIRRGATKDIQWPTKYAMPFLLAKVQWSIQICLSRWESYVFLEMFEGNAWFLQVGGDVYPVYP